MPLQLMHLVESTATGTLSMLAMLANRQAQLGHRVTVVYSRRPETPLNLSNVFDSRIRLVNVQMLSHADQLHSIRILRRLLQEEVNDAVFLHSSIAGFIGRIASLGLSDATRYFYIPHCISLMRCDVDPLTRALFVALEWAGASRRCDYIACSASEKQTIDRLIPFRRCHIIENAIDFAALPFIPNAEQRQRRPEVITAGQIRPQKNPQEFASICRVVKQQCPNVAFTWIGDGDSDQRTNLEHAGVTVTGWMSKDDVFRRMANSAVYLSTSRWEGMPVSVIEACALGLRVVVSPCVGNVDVIEEGRTGWIYHSPTHAAELVTRSLDEALGTASVLHCANTMAMARARFSMERYMQDINTLLENEAIKPSKGH